MDMRFSEAEEAFRQEVRDFLPKLAVGEMELCLGYTEPEAGPDLYSLGTRGDEDIMRADENWIPHRIEP